MGTYTSYIVKFLSKYFKHCTYMKKLSDEHVFENEIL